MTRQNERFAGLSRKESAAHFDETGRNAVWYRTVGDSHSKRTHGKNRYPTTCAHKRCSRDGHGYSTETWDGQTGTPRAHLLLWGRAPCTPPYLRGERGHEHDQGHEQGDEHEQGGEQGDEQGDDDEQGHGQGDDDEQGHEQGDKHVESSER